MKVLILNQHANNFGDEAAGTAVVSNLLKNKNVEKIELLYCMPKSLPIEDKRVIHNHDIDVRTLTKKEFIIFMLFRKKTGKFLPMFIDKLREYDTILISPCGANLGIYQDWGLLLQDIVTVQQKKTPIFHLNTISKSGSCFFDLLVRYVCKKSIVYVREKSSFDYLKSKGIEVKLGTDSVFALETKDIIKQRNDKIVFVPSDVWDWHVDFKEEERETFYHYVLNPVLEFASKYNMTISILPHVNTEREKIFNDGILDYANRNFSNVNIMIEQAKEFYDYENCIRTATFVIGMRYHAIVFAAKNAIPYVALAYEQKMREVSSYSGQIENCIDLKSLDSECLLRDKLESVLKNLESIREQLYNKCEDIKNKSLIVIKENFDE